MNYFAHSNWLFALPFALFLLVVFYYRWEKGKWIKLGEFAAAKMLGDLAASYSPLRKKLKIALVLGSTIFILLALARPQWGYEWRETKGRGIDLLIALDTSRSMLAEDVKPNRLDRAKLAILDLLDQLEGDRVGLVAFAGTAFLQCPLTLDYDAYRQTLESIDTEAIPKGGSDLASAIAEAQASFAKDDNYKILVLITDGEDLEAGGIAQARLAAQEGVKIYTVGVGSVKGDLIPIGFNTGERDYLRDEYGNPVKTSLDESTLIAIARTTGSFYVPLGNTGQGLEEVYQRGLQSLPKLEREARPKRIPTERFQWPLGAALLLLWMESILGTRRKKIPRSPVSIRLAALLAVAALILPPGPAEASPRQAQKLYDAGQYEAAGEKYRAAISKEPENARLHYNLGSTLYRTGQFEQAAETLEQSLNTDDVELQKDSFYNLGNTRYRLGESRLGANPEETISFWEQAMKDYQNALNLTPDDVDAQFNYEFVKKKLDELRNQQQNQEQNQQQDQQQNEQDQQQDQQQPQKQDQQSGDQENQEQEQPEPDQKNEDEQPRQEEPQSQEPQPKQQEPEQQPQQQPERVPGRMTREEARQLLEAIKDNEKKLPAAILQGIEKEEAAGKFKGRDW